MPIHTSWRSMVRSMLANPDYAKRDRTSKCYKFTDGKEVCGAAGGWSVFFATVRKMGADDKKPMPKKTQETIDLIVDWVVEEAKKSWIPVACKAVKSPKTPAHLKATLQKKLDAVKKKTGVDPCKGK